MSSSWLETSDQASQTDAVDAATPGMQNWGIGAFFNMAKLSR
jgi:hypothetical protein